MLTFYSVIQIVSFFHIHTKNEDWNEKYYY